jgi:S1-C subfamily serine protease
MAKNELANLSDAMADAVEKAGASVVMVNARRRLPASGVALSKDLVLTANHVVEADEDIKVSLPDGTELSAEIKGRDPGSDLVLLKLNKASAAAADTNGQPRIGQLVLALGRPSTEGIQASLGIVSAIGGPARTRMGGMLEQYIRTDAIPYPGFSGGPLIDAEGKVVGINTSGLGHGNSVVIPIELAKKIADSLEKHGSVKRGYLGVRSQVVELPNKAKLDREQKYGLMVMGVEDDSPAAAADLMIGDIIIAYNDQPTETHDELFAALAGGVVDKAAPVEILRGGKAQTLQITAAERKESPRRGHRRRVMFGGPGFMMPHRGFRRGRGRRHGHHHHDEEGDGQ